MATFVFDTHRAVKDLEEAGFPEAQAEALIEIVGAAIGENAATKSDLDAMERRMEAKFAAQEKQTAAQFEAQAKQTEIRFAALEERFDARIDASENKQNARIDALENKFDARIDALENKFDARLDALEHKLDADIRAVRADLRNMEWRITLKFVAILLPSMGLLFAALRFLG